MEKGIATQYFLGCYIYTKVFLPGEFHGQRNLAGYSPWGSKESDTTERLTLSLSYLSYSKYVVNQIIIPFNI